MLNFDYYNFFLNSKFYRNGNIKCQKMWEDCTLFSKENLRNVRSNLYVIQDLINDPIVRWTPSGVGFMILN